MVILRGVSAQGLTQKQTPPRPRGRHPTDPKVDIPWADTPVQTPDEMTVEAGSTHTTGINNIVDDKRVTILLMIYSFA